MRSDKVPSVTVMLASRLWTEVLALTLNFSWVVVRPRVSAVAALIQSMPSSIEWLKVTLAFTSMVNSPPSFFISTLLELTSRASFCFCVTMMFLLSVPARRVMVALRSSYVSLAVVRMVRLAFPAFPLSGDTLHQLSARVLTTETLQSLLAVNSMVLSPPSDLKLGVSEVAGISI